MATSFSHPARFVIGLLFLLSWLAFPVLTRLGADPVLSLCFPFGVLLVSCIGAWVLTRNRQSRQGWPANSRGSEDFYGR